VVNYWDGTHNNIFALGGQSKKEVHDSMEKYDFEKKQWVLKASMKSPRTMFSATYMDGYIYAFGGFKDLKYFFPEPAFERYSIADDSWEAIDLADTKISSL
jgi:hypothetical protein